MAATTEHPITKIVSVILVVALGRLRANHLASSCLGNLYGFRRLWIRYIIGECRILFASDHLDHTGLRCALCGIKPNPDSRATDLQRG